VNMTINKRGDDGYFNRLFSYFQEQFQGQIKHITPIRKKVYLVETSKKKYILKGYSSYKKLKLQETFTSTLRKEGFLDTYVFEYPAGTKPFAHEGLYFGCIEYLEPHRVSFSYKTQGERKEGLQLLREFHQVTSGFEKRYRTLIPNADLLGKWKDRAQYFSHQRPILESFLKRDVIDELMEWAYWSMEGMEKNKEYFTKKPNVILHGDVAHHNFLRSSSGKLMLIDFDLIGIGPDSLDLLQYANRILPFMQWSYGDLKKYPFFKNKMESPAFLYSLAYPADIFREWNRIIKDQTYIHSSQSRQVYDLTVGQWSLRKQFFKILKKRISSD